MTRDPQALRAALAAKKRRLDEARPLAAKALAALDRWYDVELTYASNAIEGNTLTRSETAVEALLFERLDASLDRYLEAAEAAGRTREVQG